MTQTEKTITPDEAKRVLRAEYYSDVKSMAEDLKSRVEAREIASYEGLDEAVWEDCDGSQWVIYSGRNWQLLFVSDNESAYFDEGLGDGSELVSSDGLKTEVLAFYALRRDLWEALETLGIDHRYKFGEDDESDEDEDKGEEA